MRHAFRFSATAAAWSVIAFINGWLLVVLPGHAGNAPGWRGFVTPAITTNMQLSQTFRMKMPNLNAIEVRTAVVGKAAGKIRLDLVDFDIDCGPLVVRSAEIDAKTLVDRESYTFQFDPIADSGGHRFRFDILSSPDAPSSGVGFWATTGERYREGTLLANERERWADLAFQTHTPARSTLRALLDSRHLPRNAGLVALAGFFVSWLALGVVLREAARPDLTV